MMDIPFRAFVEIPFVRINPNAIMPVKSTIGAAAFDFCLPKDQDPFRIGPGETRKIPLGIAVAIPEGYCLLFLERSGIAANTPLILKAGLIDSDYRGELCAVYYNSSDSVGEIILQQAKIVQGVILPMPTVLFVESFSGLTSTNRGENGFGSTGR